MVKSLVSQGRGVLTSAVRPRLVVVHLAGSFFYGVVNVTLMVV